MNSKTAIWKASLLTAGLIQSVGAWGAGPTSTEMLPPTREVWNSRSDDGRWVTIRNQSSKAYHYAKNGSFVGIGRPPGKMSYTRFYAWDGLILSAGETYGIDPVLMKAIILSESSFNQFAVSSAGAQGGAQIMPATAKTLGVDNPFDPQQFIYGCAAHLRRTMDHFSTANMIVMVAAYNAGDRAVERAVLKARNAGKGDDIRAFVPAIRETRGYVNTVLWNWHRMHTGE